MMDTQRKKVQLAKSGYKQSLVTRLKRQESLLKTWRSTKLRKKVSRTSKSRWANMSEAARCAHSTKVRAAAQLYWAGLSASQRSIRNRPFVEAGHTATAAKPGSSLEAKIKWVLDFMGVAYQQQKKIGPYFADFYLPGRNAVVECDGYPWHSTESAKAHDSKRDTFMRSLGYSVIRITGQSINKNAAVALFSGLGMVCLLRERLVSRRVPVPANKIFRFTAPVGGSHGGSHAEVA